MSNSPNDWSPDKLTYLRETMSNAFTLDGIRSLCFDLGILYENIPASDGTISGTVRELIILVKRLDKLDMLLEACKRANPSINWHPIPPKLPEEPPEPPEEPIEADPRFIPDPGYAIIGREKDIALLQNSFNINKLVVLEGLAGIGKTSVAAEYALESLEKYKKILWYFVEAGDSIKTILVALAGQFDELGDPRLLISERNPQLTVRDRINQLLNLLDESKMLLVLDSFENVVDDQTYFIKPEFSYLIRQLFNRAYRSHVLLISKIKIRFNPEYFNKFSTYELPGLKLDDAIALFTSLGKRVNHTISPRDAALVCRETGGHPFALTIITGLLREGYPLHRLLDQMRQKVLADYGQFLLDIIYGRLSKSGKRFFAAVSVYRRLVPLRALEKLPGDATRLEELLPYFLIQLEPESSRYFMHAIVREYAYQKLSRHEERKLRAHRMAGDYYAALTNKGTRFRNIHDVNTVQHVLEAQHHYREANYLQGTIEMSVYVVDELKPLVKQLDRDGEDELAERLYQSILAVDNRDAYIHFNYARFLSRCDADLDKIEHHYHQAALLKPNKFWMQKEYILWLTERQKFEEAYSWFWSIMSQDGYEYSLFLTYANVLIVNQRYEEATAVLKKALDYLPDEHWHQFYQRYSKVLRETNQRETAVTLLQSALEAVPEHGLKEIYVEYSKVLRELDRLEEALELLEKGLKAVSPEFGLRDIYIEVARVLRELGRLETADNYLDAALKILPKQGIGQVYVQYSQILREMNERERAVALLASGLEVVPEQSLGLIYVQYGQVLRELKRKEEAAELLKSALDVVQEQSLGHIYVQYSQVLRELNQKEEAAELLNAALKIVPEQGLPDIYVELSQVLRELNRHEEAVELLKPALEKQPLGQLYMQYSQVLRDIEQYDTAVALLNEAIDVVPERGLRDIYVEYSQVLREFNQREAAIELLENALKVVPVQGLAQVYVQYSQVLRELDRHETAVQLLKPALDIVPEQGLRDIFVEVSKVLREMNQHEPAAKLLISALASVPEPGLPDIYGAFSQTMREINSPDNVDDLFNSFLANVPKKHQQLFQQIYKHSLLKAEQVEAP